MKLVVLGSGTCVPSLKRCSPGYYLTADGCQVIVDLGSGALLQLEKAGLRYMDIDAVFITHSHPDHFSDLIPLIQALVATPDAKRQKGLSVFGSQHFTAYIEKAISSVLGREHNFPLDLVAVTDTLDFGPFHVLAAKTVHSADSLAYRFEHGEKAVVFTGDADFDEELIMLSKNADLLVADCSFPDTLKAQGHLSAKECGLLAQKAMVKKLLLSHLYPSDTPDIDRVYESRKEFTGQIVLAEDLIELEL
jgi:ribonuclease BN (tRNA processing enzyme)